MSIQFGKLNFDGRTVDPAYLRDAEKILRPFSPDSLTAWTKGPFALLYGDFHSVPERDDERLPVHSPAGTRLTWTGRLDNRTELLAELSVNAASNPTDAQIVSWLYERKGGDCLARLVGDWSLSTVSDLDEKLLLAVDFLGARPLYYLRTVDSVAWSSILEPLLLLAGTRFTLCEEYAAGWLYGFPSAELTPYREIRAVPPGSSVEFTRNGVRVERHWKFSEQESAQSCGDAEFEEGFRYFFARAVRRRLRSSRPVLSELSGGMDSSAIVCVADQLLKDDPALAPRLDTLSYLNDAEPDWNERPFVEAVEHHRGRSGHHIDVSGKLELIPRRDENRFPSTPSHGILLSLPQRQVSNYLEETGIRVILSGLGGDETTGGVPDGNAELADLLVGGELSTFLKRAVLWCLPTRQPLICVVGSVLGHFVPRQLFEPRLLRNRVPWIAKKLERNARDNPACAPLKLSVRGPRPSVQENLHTLEDLRRQIARASTPSSQARERRYPFLDRDLLEFLYNAPREQIIRPGRRRSLMRRALSGIVPEAVLERKRKAYASRKPIVSFQACAPEIQAWAQELHCAAFGLVDPLAFQRALDAASRGEDSRLWPVSNTLTFESWLRDERVQRLLAVPANFSIFSERRKNTGLPAFAVKSSQPG